MFGKRVEEDEDERVVEGSLEPLDRVGHKRVLLENHEVASERADALASHGVLQEGGK